MQCFSLLSFARHSQFSNMRVIDCAVDSKASAQRTRADAPRDSSNVGLRGNFPKSETTIHLSEIKDDKRVEAEEWSEMFF